VNLSIYLDNNSMVHRLDPRTKILTLLSINILSLIFSNIFILIGLLASVLFFVMISDVLANMKYISRILLFFGLFYMILWAFVGQGDERVLYIISLKGVAYGLCVWVKMSIMFITGMILVSTTKVEEFSLGLISLGIPFKVAFSVTTALRLVPLILSKISTVIQAQKSRGLDLDSGNVITKTMKFIPLFIPIFVLCIRNANELAMALESKGFGGCSKRTYYLNVGFKTNDYMLICSQVLVLLSSLAMKFAYHVL
jgi:energy-coupling factor transport system permease protein